MFPSSSEAVRRRRRWARPAVLAPLLLLLSGCNASTWYRAGMPVPVTKQAVRILPFWQASVIASLAVAGFIIVLVTFASIAFRAKGNALPRQVKYNMPIEVAFTAIPFVIIGYMFYFTAIDENYENKLSAHPQMVIGVVGFQWSWQFNYAYDAKYGSTGLQVTGRPGQPPQLVLPTDTTIRFVETSPDVVHSFWVEPFLFKRDVVAGRTNEFEVTIIKTGLFQGRCAEYCGVDHDRMIFSVRALTPQQFRAFVLTAKKAQNAHGRIT